MACLLPLDTDVYSWKHQSNILPTLLLILAKTASFPVYLIAVFCTLNYLIYLHGICLSALFREDFCLSILLHMQLQFLEQCLTPRRCENICCMNNLFGLLQARASVLWNTKEQLPTSTPTSIITWKCPISEILSPMEIHSNCYPQFLEYIFYCFIPNSSRLPSCNTNAPTIIILLACTAAEVIESIIHAH